MRVPTCRETSRGPCVLIVFHGMMKRSRTDGKLARREFVASMVARGMCRAAMSIPASPADVESALGACHGAIGSAAKYTCAWIATSTIIGYVEVLYVRRSHARFAEL